MEMKEWDETIMWVLLIAVLIVWIVKGIIFNF